jgi:hypothetical protein
MKGNVPGLHSGKSLSVFAILLLSAVGPCAGQQDSVFRPASDIRAFADLFYAWDFSEPGKESRQPFLYNHNRHHTPACNLGFLRVSTDQRRFRGSLALQAGTYVQDNYRDEPFPASRILEAQAGIALNRSRSAWLNAGIMPSYIGYESAVISENPTLSRSLAAENSPYYMSGISVNGMAGKNWSWMVMLCNGWQRITPENGQLAPALGNRLQYTTAGGLLINWSAYHGNMRTEYGNRFRAFHNFYGQWPAWPSGSIVIGLDTGAQADPSEKRKLNPWYAFLLIAKHEFSPRWSVASRIEYFQDDHETIIPNTPADGFLLSGTSVNLDCRPLEKLLLRFEYRWLGGPRPSLYDASGSAPLNNSVILTSVSIDLQHSLTRRHETAKAL